MKLILPDNLQSAEPTIPVRWCISRAESESLKVYRASQIHILFIIAYEGTDLEDRVLLPIEQMMTFLNFRRPGKHTIFSRIVWISSCGLFDVEEVLLKKVNIRDYGIKLLDRKKLCLEEDSFNRNNVFHLGDTEVEVCIPEEHFPKEPPVWLSKIVNKGFDYPPADQCEFRRRLFSLPIRGVFILFYHLIFVVCATIFRSISALVLLLFGTRNIGFEAIIHPYRNDTNDIWYLTDKRDSWFLRDKNFNKKSKWFLLIHPVIYVFIFIILTWIKFLLKLTYNELFVAIFDLLIQLKVYILSFLAKLFTSIILIVSSLFVIGILSMLIWFSVKQWRKFKKNKKKDEFLSWHQKLELERKRADNKYDDLYRQLSCKPTKMLARLSDIPKERRTIKLKFLDLKAKVCRPYAAK